MPEAVIALKKCYTKVTERLFTERYPFPAKNQTLTSYRVYISPTKWASSALIQIQSATERLLKAAQRMFGSCKRLLEQCLRTIVQQVTPRLPAMMPQH